MNNTAVHTADRFEVRLRGDGAAYLFIRSAPGEPWRMLAHGDPATVGIILTGLARDARAVHRALQGEVRDAARRRAVKTR